MKLDKPERSNLGTVIDADLLLKVRESARKNRRTLSGEITVLLETALALRDSDTEKT